ncbi:MULTISPECIES: outer membrane beta-barrel protein [Roseobacteraceae]|uniref:Outer membrane protein beta-barrel domain protein n=1 Tax=Pseudosulfitobacter pseudonitzschiae TaxID=1402135 RepID=A0A221K0H5_9RHOB|nr:MULTISPECIES: outer membrane beta-barrel protein [Roseobacteraceae]ASM72495.1 outer membrane protein beta-barrel domain protein [Pseudosulfitobacter pseudonitzschiae]
MKILGLSIAAVCLAGTGANAQNISYEIYGGVALEDSSGLNYGGTNFAMDHGSTFGVGAYLDPIRGFEFGLDIMVTDRRYDGFVSGVETASLMVNARYPFAISSTIEGYVGLGLGVVDVKYDGNTAFPAFSGSDAVAGGQISLGASYALPRGQIFTELKYQEAFKDATIVGADVGYNSTSFLVGYRF